MKFYTPIAMLFVALLIVVNLIVQKIIYIGTDKLLLTAADVIYPLAYLLSITLTEVYGYAMSRRVIWSAFACNILVTGIIMFAIILPPNPLWNNQTQFANILGQAPRFVAASLCAFVTGEFIGTYTLAKLKIFTSGKYLWLRTIGSAAIAQLIDCIIFISIAFYVTLTWHYIFIMVFTVFWSKIIYQIILTPGVYALTNFLKKQEGIDTYDRNTNFNPFRFF